MKHLLYLFLLNVILSQTTGKISGTVIDGEDNEPIIGANVLIKGTSLGTASDLNGNFYILKSKEKNQIPTNMAGEMIPYDTGLGDFRVHYAGFFDPGFGDPKGSYAVLEIKTNELPFIIEDGQTIARIKYEKLNKKTSMVYGSNIKSNYQNQKLALAKHFK